MRIYMAPMEGVTTYIFRQNFNEFFNGVDKFFTPFISPNCHKCFNDKEKKEFLPDNNRGMVVVPQILTNNADDFIKTTQELEEFGYDEVNFNLGCPSGTVASKGRGSGFLAKTEELDRFLDRIYSECKVKISIKTRIGKYLPDEFEEILEIYNKYPIEELIIHPRTQKDYYRNTPNLDVFEYAVKNSRNKLCYNGDIFRQEDYNLFNKRFNSIDCIMLGRGIVGNPGFAELIKDKRIFDKFYLKEYHDRIYGEYKEILFGDRTVLFKMKELWKYMICIFTEYEKYWKKIKKSNSLSEYDTIINRLFTEQDIDLNLGYKVS